MTGTTGNFYDAGFYGACFHPILWCAGASRRTWRSGVRIRARGRKPSRRDPGAGHKEPERLAWLGEEPRRRLAEARRFEVVDLAPLAGHSADLRGGGGCDARLARETGLAITGWVQNVSNLLVDMNTAAQDAGTTRLLADKSVGVRSNTQQSFLRALECRLLVLGA